MVGQEVHGWSSAQLPRSDPIVGRYCLVERLDERAHTAELFEAYAADFNWRQLDLPALRPIFDIGRLPIVVTEVTVADDPLFFAVVDSSTEGLPASPACYVSRPVTGLLRLDIFTSRPCCNALAPVQRPYTY